MISNKIIVLCLLLTVACGSSTSDRANCSATGPAIKIASKIRKLRPLEKVPCEVHGKEQIANFLVEKVMKNIDHNTLKGQEIVGKLLGSVPLDYQYKEGLVEIYTSNLGGYYEPGSNSFVMADWLSEEAQSPTIIHELVHALQDQHFAIENLLNGEIYSSDQISAHSALAEGDASAVTYDYQASRFNKPLVADYRVLPEGVFPTEAIKDSENIQIKTPLAFKKMLMFPYSEGLKFVHRLIREDGYKGINKAYKLLPESTEQILHPELYISGEKGFKELEPELPDQLKDRVTTEPFYEDRLGEFYVSVLLSETIPDWEAKEAASGWGGDKVAYYPFKEQSSKSTNFKNNGVLTWTLAWDTAGDAKEFFHALGKAYSNRFKVRYSRRPKNYVFKDRRIGQTVILIEDKKVGLVMIGS